MAENIKSTDILKFIEEGQDIIVPLGNGEPDEIITVLEKEYSKLKNVTIHQILSLKERDYINGKFKGHLEHTSYFLSPVTRKAYLNGDCDFVPCHFHQMPRVLENTAKKPIVLAMSSPIDENGYFSLGTGADYVSSFIGKVPFILEVNKQMPYTFGENKIHISQVTAFTEVNYPLVELKSPPITDVDIKVAEYIMDYIPNNSTLQIGIGGIPNAVMSFLKDHKNMGIHSEMITDGLVDLVNTGVVTGKYKNTNPNKIVGTFILGTQKLYDFVNNNQDIYMMGVEKTNDPRNIALEESMISINASTEIDLFGQCASETIGGKLYSGTGGQFDFVYGSRFAKNGKSFICMPSTAKNGTISRIKFQLTENSIVTTPKNDVDFIVTEFGIAELKYKSMSKRAEELINIAHPNFREELFYEAKKNGLII